MQIIHDIKSMSAARREALRREAYDAYQNGVTGHKFAKTHKIYSATVYSWYKEFDERGPEAIREAKRGPAKNTGSLLNSK